MCREWELMGIPIPIPTIPGNFGNGNENLSWGIIPTIPGNMGMGMNFRGKSQIPMGIPKNEFLSVKSQKFWVKTKNLENLINFDDLIYIFYLFIMNYLLVKLL